MTDPAEAGGTSNVGFSYLLQTFLELREKGSSVSAADLDCLRRWQAEGLSPQKLAEEMQALKRECLKRDEEFPKTLKGLEHRMRRSTPEPVLPSGNSEGDSHEQG